MSADLFAEFGTSQSQQQRPSGKGQEANQRAQTFGFFDDLTCTSTAPPPSTQTPSQSFQFGTNKASTVDDADDWGEFEGVETAPVKQDPFFFPSSSQQSNVPPQPAPILKAKKSLDPNVLFDADDDHNGEEEEEDFGDFEGPEESAQVAAAPSSSAGLEDLVKGMRISQPSAPPPRYGLPALSSTKRSPAGSFGTVSRSKQASTIPIPSEAQQEETWDDFDEWEASIPAATQPTAMLKATSEANVMTSNARPSLSSPTVEELQSGELPPTNVPPPGVLLSLFSSLIGEAQEKLFKPMTAQTLPMRNKLLSEPTTIVYLQGYLMLASVAARIIAGRKLRWKRDTHLSQGMRIGPASSRATSGMKLAGVDKAEAMKEDREVSDLVRVWKDQVGRLRHVVSAANQAKAGSLGPVPDIQETMLVKTLKQTEGGIPARMPCMLCGLKRDERVAMVDQYVQDSFGEWWVDQVNMHRGCRNFWHEHKDQLRQR
ncbi:uncharacterized protein BDR25DRAFT_339011 [Lindgomyces ingoldianus]|uniref:Uncharacterized protein n=1 Tax=Lindgomyces ingoldianus TaxID=673940 RepID=A0ACB6RCC6_9PLEO|nr:uncharacterized protein BDR25DRAFT_339011 [Lindgomyces ingoldianus]KAF2476904.1 hypothetical protein BDR25DRAFT_339011 [Lindgomyces ingoldianus]